MNTTAAANVVAMYSSRRWATALIRLDDLMRDPLSAGLAELTVTSVGTRRTDPTAVIEASLL